MIISPKVGVWLSVIFMLGGLITGFTTYFADFGLTQHQITIILDIDAMAMAIGNGLNALLHMIPASAPTTTAEANKFMLGPIAKA